MMKGMEKKPTATSQQPTNKARTQKQHLEMMLSFKVNPCKEKKKKIDEVHINTCFDWHPKAGDRRRNPRQYIYNIQSRCEEFHSTLYAAVAAQQGTDKQNKTRAEGKCKNGDMCSQYHHKFEALYHPRFYKTNPCTFYTQKGRCTNKFCAFIHPGEEGDYPVLFETREKAKLAILDAHKKINEARKEGQPTQPQQTQQQQQQSSQFQQLAPSPFTQTKFPPLNPWAKPGPTQQQQKAMMKQRAQPWRGDQRASMPATAAPFYPSQGRTGSSASPFDIFQLGESDASAAYSPPQEGGGSTRVPRLSMPSLLDEDDGEKEEVTPAVLFSPSDPVFHPSSRHGKSIDPISPRRLQSTPALATTLIQSHLLFAGLPPGSPNSGREEPVSPGVLRNEREREEMLEREMEEWEKLEEEKLLKQEVEKQQHQLHQLQFQFQQHQQRRLSAGYQQQQQQQHVMGWDSRMADAEKAEGRIMNSSLVSGVALKDSMYIDDMAASGGVVGGESPPGSSNNMAGSGSAGTVIGVEEFLQSLDLGKYIPNLVKHEVDMELLRTLSMEDLMQSLGLPWGPAKKIISKLHQSQEDLLIEREMALGLVGSSSAAPSGYGRRASPPFTAEDAETIAARAVPAYHYY